VYLWQSQDTVQTRLWLSRGGLHIGAQVMYWSGLEAVL
jgi:hypothetical protein